MHLHPRSGPDLNQKFHVIISSVTDTADDVQMNASRVQPYSAAEPSAVGSRPGTAKCKRTVQYAARVQLGFLLLV